MITAPENDSFPRIPSADWCAGLAAAVPTKMHNSNASTLYVRLSFMPSSALSALIVDFFTLAVSALILIDLQTAIVIHIPNAIAFATIATGSHRFCRVWSDHDTVKTREIAAIILA
ncbi:hypothetical protein D3C75_1125740 [compost metagenome]